jgi:hypothetical protein
MMASENQHVSKALLLASGESILFIATHHTQAL